MQKQTLSQLEFTPIEIGNCLVKYVVKTVYQFQQVYLWTGSEMCVRWISTNI